MQAQERQGCATCCLMDDGCANFCEALTASGGSLETRSAVMATIQARHLRNARAHLAALRQSGWLLVFAMELRVDPSLRHSEYSIPWVL